MHEPDSVPLLLTDILGHASDARYADQLHRLAHDGLVETITVDRDDTLRRRLRVRTDKGTDCAIALSRDQRLSDGALLVVSDERAIVVRMTVERWLSLRPVDAETALELGYFAGNLHWRVAFDGNVLKVALEGPERDYLDRLSAFLESKRVSRIDDA